MSIYLRELSSALGALGHQVDLFTRASEPTAPQIVEIGANVRLIHLSDGLGPLAKDDLYPHSDAFADSINAFSRVNGIRYNAIFSHYWLSGCIGQLLQQAWKVPHLIMFHTLGAAKNDYCSGEYESALRIETEGTLARNCDRIIAAATMEKENLRRYYDLAPQKITVIPCGVDRNLFRPLNRAQTAKKLGTVGSKIILAVGRIEPVKGFDLVINAVSLLPAHEKVRILIIGGDGKRQAQIKQLDILARNLGIAQKINFLGTIDHRQLPLYYNAAAVTVIASHYESFGLIALESIACGTPVLATPVGVLPELIKPGDGGLFGRLIEGRSPAHWAEEIHTVLNRAETIANDDIDTKLAPYNWPSVAARIAEECCSAGK